MNLHLVPIQISNSLLLSKLKTEISHNLNSPVEILEIMIDINRSFSKERNQYFSTQILNDLVLATKGREGKFIALVNYDIFVPVFTYIFGEAQLNGNNSVVSLFRFHEELYTGKTNEELFFQRCLKEVYHELGHNFGLLHCKDWSCVMHASQGIEEVDIKGDFYCNNCYSFIKLRL